MGGHNDSGRKYNYDDLNDERGVLHSDEVSGSVPERKADAGAGTGNESGSLKRESASEPRTSVFNERRGRPKRGEHRRDWTVEPSGD